MSVLLHSSLSKQNDLSDNPPIKQMTMNHTASGHAGRLSRATQTMGAHNGNMFPLQTYAIPAEIGLKKFQPNAVWRHSVSDLDSGLTWVVDFKYS